LTRYAGVLVYLSPDKLSIRLRLASNTRLATRRVNGDDQVLTTETYHWRARMGSADEPSGSCKLQNRRD
jgi:hypothetical protein